MQNQETVQICGQQLHILSIMRDIKIMLELLTTTS